MKNNNRDRFLFMPKISLKPDRVTKYNEVLIRNYEDGILESISKSRAKVYEPDTSKEIKITKKFHNFEISENAQRTIKQKVNWLYLLAKSKYIKTYNGKEIFNFKINFLTLTLPSKQVHPSSFITKNCFNQVITELRQRYGMRNFVWRLEFQGNGNLHYHIVTDSYIDYFAIRDIWNRVLNKYGYVDAYTKKFENITLSQYWEDSKKYKENTFEVCAKRYAKGKEELWKKPPSVDVKCCTTHKSIANYISKYFGKKEKSGAKKNELDNEENSFSLRLWFCSRSLSKLISIVEYQEIIPIDWFRVLKGADNVREVILDYCTCLFFDLGKLSNYIKSIMNKAFREYANENGYSSA